jgi:tetratricopeptide (TPR) repeat protein
MNETRTYTQEEAHQYFAKTLNGEVWDLLEKPARDQSEDERMVHAAHASAYHWLHAGSGVHQQRAEWLIAHVYTKLGLAGSALRHASRCFELTEKFGDSLKDFDRAYAHEGLARANALAGNRDQALEHIKLAQQSGSAIENDEDRGIFLGDFEGGDWYGLR